MSRSGQIELDFGDMQGAGEGGKHVFRLTIGKLKELQEKCGVGPKVVLTRLYDGTWRVEDIFETIRLGLIGGGMQAVDAAKMTERYVADGSLLEHVVIAQMIVMSALASVEDEPLKKAEGAEETTPSTTTTTDDLSSPSPPSTNSAPR